MNRINQQRHMGARAAAGAALLAMSVTLCGTGCVLDTSGRSIPPRDWGGSDDPGGSGSGSGQGAHLYRRQITIEAGTAAVPAEYSVRIEIDHAGLLAEGKSLPSGDDVRVVRAIGGAVTELDRVLAPDSAWDRSDTTLWFRTESQIGPEQSDGSYYLFYGDARPAPPLEDASKVFLFWDDFDAPELDARWVYSNVGAAKGSVALQDGVLRMSSQSGDLGGQEDDFALLHVEASGGISVESATVGFGGTLGDAAKLGGVMIRQSTDARSRHHVTCRRNGDRRLSAYRTADHAGTIAAELDAVSPFTHERSRIDRLGNIARTSWSEGGELLQQGGSMTFAQPLKDPIRVGIPLATNRMDQAGWVEVDWFRVRKLVDPEPGAMLSAESRAN